MTQTRYGLLAVLAMVLLAALSSGLSASFTKVKGETREANAARRRRG